MRILEPQFDEYFVGRDNEIKTLKEKIEGGRGEIIVVRGERGVGKTNLMLVVERELKEKEIQVRHISGLLFNTKLNEIFKPAWWKRITGGSISILGSGGGVNLRDDAMLDMLRSVEKSDERVIFIEDAHNLGDEELDLIYSAVGRNKRLRFVLEIATPYEVKLKAGSYEIVELGRLEEESMRTLVGVYELPGRVKEIILRASERNPYIARSLISICIEKKREEKMLEFLGTLRDNAMGYNLNQMHRAVLNTLGKGAEELVKTLSVAPPYLTLGLMRAFCGEGIDEQLDELIRRGILIEDKDRGLYRIYYSLFRMYLREIQPARLQRENKEKMYKDAMEKLDPKDKLGAVIMLFEVMDVERMFKELVKLVRECFALPP